jgi:hypothetical protein
MAAVVRARGVAFDADQSILEHLPVKMDVRDDCSRHGADEPIESGVRTWLLVRNA